MTFRWWHLWVFVFIALLVMQTVFATLDRRAAHRALVACEGVADRALLRGERSVELAERVLLVATSASGFAMGLMECQPQIAVRPGDAGELFLRPVDVEALLHAQEEICGVGGDGSEDFSAPEKVEGDAQGSVR